MFTLPGFIPDLWTSGPKLVSQSGSQSVRRYQEAFWEILALQRNRQVEIFFDIRYLPYTHANMQGSQGSEGKVGAAQETPSVSKQARINKRAMTNHDSRRFFPSGGEVMLALDDILAEPWLMCG